jgi:hypothetical protein
MRNLRTALLGIAAIGLIGAVAYAADAPKTHVLTIPLPNGGVEQIRYTGDVAPTVVFRQGSPAAAAWASPFGPGSPFAVLDRIQAEMDRQMAAMMQHPLVMPPMPQVAGGRLQQVTAGAIPPGAQSYSVVSTVSGGHACMQSVEVTSQGPGQAPKVVRRSSGDCGAAQTAPAAPAAPAVAIPPGRRTSI